MASASNFRTLKRRHNVIDARNVFVNKTLAKWSVKAATLSRVTRCKQFRVQSRFCQVKSHVQKARESPDLNMDFCSFDNGFKQNRATKSMREYRDHTCFSCINICRVLRMLFEHEADRPSVQHHPRDPASVYAMIQKHVWSYFLHILPYFNQIRTENAAKTLNCPFSDTGMVSAVYFRTS